MQSTEARTWFSWRTTLCPLIRASPLVGNSSVVRILISVVLSYVTYTR